MVLIQMLLPLCDSSGQRLPHDRYVQVREELTQRFGGVTAFLRSPAEGTWKTGEAVVDRDQVVMCEVMTDVLDRGWWTAYRGVLEARFDQEALVVRAIAIERL